jgi:hypothetical protein
MQIKTLFLVSLTPATRGDYSGYVALLVSRSKEITKHFLFEEQIESFAPHVGKVGEYLITTETRKGKTLTNVEPVPEISNALSDFLEA